MPKITKRLVDGLKPKTKDYMVWDTEVPGFGVRVKKGTGTKSFCIQYRNAQGRSRRLTVGRYGRLTVQEGRKQARKLLAKSEEGRDPTEEKTATRRAPTVADLCERYMVEHAEPKKRPSSITKDRSLIDRHIIPILGKHKAEAITTKDMAQFHHEMRATPIQANRCLALASKMFNLAEAWGLRPQHTNPCQHIQRYKENKRERYLSTEELARLGEALRNIEQEGSELPSVVTAIRLLILTGCRRGEILGLKWAHVEYENSCLVLPESKTGAKRVPLSAPALELLRNTPRQAGNPYVCPGLKPMGHLVGLSRAWYRIRARAGLNDLRLHDLRHSFASVGAGAGLSLQMIGALLGHTVPATTARYAHLAQDPLKQAADIIGDRISEAMEAPVKSKVIPLPTNRK